MHHRPERLGKLIQRELGMLILRTLETPGAIASITGVEVSAKLDLAKVKVSVWPSERSADVLKALQAARGDFQRELMRKIRIKTVPRIRFETDYGVENAARVEKALLGQ